MSWEYQSHPKCSVSLPHRTNILLQTMWSRSFNISSALADTRSIHRHLFEELVPPDAEYFAGHYRGEDFPDLKLYKVTIRDNPDVGCPPDMVVATMQRFSQLVDKGLLNLDALHASQNSSLEEKLRKTVSFACAIFVKFTNIHPYANGNGHIGRFLLLAVFKKYGYEIRGWTIDPRPSAPEYIACVRFYENGEKEPLLRWVMQLIQLP
jgi:fido (protein-threonine AMPylation protein)